MKSMMGLRFAIWIEPRRRFPTTTLEMLFQGGVVFLEYAKYPLRFR